MCGGLGPVFARTLRAQKPLGNAGDSGGGPCLLVLCLSFFVSVCQRVCVVAAGRSEQAMKSLPHLCMQVLRHASRVRVHVAIFRRDERLRAWLIEQLEALIIAKTVMIWYAEDVDQLWHDADWKNALHLKAIAEGATVVPRE